jgi:Flp pilus assembly protein TadD
MGKASSRRNIVAESPKRDRLLIAGTVAIVLLTIAVYVPAIRAGFIWDDNDYLTENPLITDPGGLAKIWFSTDQPSQYFPLVYTTFRVEHAVWGMNPLGFHLVNVLLHIANALLLWLILRRLSIRGAWLAAAIFALHPMQVESVAWVTERKNVLSTLFYLLALLASLRFMESERGWRKYYVLGLISYMLALFAKTTACTLPAAIFVVHWLRGRRIGSRETVRVLPFLALGVGMGVLSIWWERVRQGTFGSEFALSLMDRLIIASRALCFYLAKLFAPLGLTFSYPKWEVNSASLPQYTWLLGCVAAGCLLWAFRKRARGAVAASIFFVATLSPMLGFINLYTFRYTFVADHYQYVACIGPIVLFAWLISRTWANRGLDTAMRRVLPCLVLATLGALTWRQAGVYTDSETLWRDTLAKNPGSWLAHNNLANLLTKRGDLDEGVTHYYEALKLNPGFAEGHLNLGIVLERQGRYRDAIEHYEKALEIAPDWADAHYNMGIGLGKMGQTDEAIIEYEKAVEIRPEYVEAHNNLGIALISRGDPQGAIEHFTQVLAIYPDHAQAHRNLAVALFYSGRYADAWNEARLATQYGNPPDLGFIEALSRKMPPP